MAGLLDGVRVVEAAILLVGDHLGMLLGDEGADVVKIESPGLGDYIRDHMGAIAPRCSPFHLYVNRNKRSLSLDLKREEAQEVLRRLVIDADVFVTGFAADNPARLGMGYEQVRAIKPDIVYCQATGFGARGPYATLPAHGGMMNALVAAPLLGRDRDGHAREVADPTRRPAADGVIVGPLYAAFAVASALLRRERTGEGAYIDISCADAVLASSWLTSLLEMNQERLQRVAMPASDIGGVTARYAYYGTADDKYILFCPEELKFWRRFCDAIDRPDLLERHDDSVITDFGDDPELYDELQRIFDTRTQRVWIELFLELGIPGAPALGLAELGDDPHITARRMLLDEHHPDAGLFHTLADPIRVDGEEFALRTHAARVGEHTDAVLAELGYSGSQIEGLRAGRVV